MIRKDDRVRCSPRCDYIHANESIGIVTSVANMPWPIIVEWLDGTSSAYEENELEVCECN
jgi:hypothetical protein